MDEVHPKSTRRRGLWATLAIATVAGASVVTIGLPATSKADPEVQPRYRRPRRRPRRQPARLHRLPPPWGSRSTSSCPGAPVPPPADPNAPAPPTAPVDPNAPPPDPNAGRITNAVGGFSFVLPAGWVESDASHLDYGSALLSKSIGQPPMPGQAPGVANDTRIVLGRLDQKLYASAEADNAKAAVRLGSDMGEFFMPYPGTRINQEASHSTPTGWLGARRTTRSSSAIPPSRTARSGRA